MLKWDTCRAGRPPTITPPPKKKVKGNQNIIKYTEVKIRNAKIHFYTKQQNSDEPDLFLFLFSRVT